MDLAEVSERGLVFDSVVRDPTPCDFAAVGPAGLFVAYAYWWKLGSWGHGNGVDTFTGTVTQNGPWWVLGGREDGLTATLGPPEPDAEGLNIVLSEHRQWQDMERPAYLRQLAELTAWLGQGYDLTGWARRIVARPVVDSVATLNKSLAQTRRVGILTIADPENRVRDALVIDENGDSAVSRGDFWLAQLGSTWKQYAGDRPGIETYLTWLGTQSYPGPMRVQTRPVIFRRESVQQIATTVVRVA